jgi:hypothetical protein
MIRRRSLVVVLLAAWLWGGTLLPVHGTDAAAESLPARLSDRDFWKLVVELSEPNGSFRSENLLSNEVQFQHVIPQLLRTTKPGRAYLGVGPEQNFTYVAALKPAIAFVVDVRRGNLDLHLLYKALFELARDRAEFVSLLFSKPRPAGLNAKSTADDIFEAYSTTASSERLFIETMSAIRNQLFTRHGFSLGDDDLRGIEFVHRAFFMFGPRIQYSPVGLGGGTVQPTYAELMAATDNRGEARGFLSSEEAFTFVKNLESRNLIVPVVGNFAGPKAIRGIAAYLKQKGATVSTFYLSNVEEYLQRDGIWPAFCENVATLPFDDSSAFIRSVRSTSGDPADGLRSELGAMVRIANCGQVPGQ